ncbi:MAG: aminoglycoside phosphotransferase family protein [Lachnospiraceae bacterium]|nr:aminoglycoside phosphotransferase family protein [Lachnospiraceae bacterium]
MAREEREVLQIAEQFEMEGVAKGAAPHGNGHINDTYLITCETDAESKKYILQRVNHEIFKKPWELMENVVKVTEFLQNKIKENGGDPERETLHVVPAKDGTFYYKAEGGSYWRMYRFIDGATSYDVVKEPKDFYESALAFGHFQKLLADYPAKELFETIPNFHNTVDRLANFKKALEEDAMHRAAEVQEEIQFVLDREKDCHILCDMLSAGEIPLRVTHNDTKLNNIMIDNETRKGICIIDLDTVMPGSALYDYGDSIRFGANTGEEDEKDLSKISCDLELFDLYTKGYIEGCEGSLTPLEIRMMPMGAKLMTLECGMRFLADYLEGDHYFKIHRPEHNLDRARTQFCMVKDMEDKWEKMQKIVEKYL